MKSPLQLWHLCSALLFAALLVWGLVALDLLNALPISISLLDMTLIALAIFRLTRLAVYDTITQSVRDWFSGSPANTLRGTIGTLINCSWCVGMWFALLVSFAYFATPYAWYVIFVFALAGIGSFLQLFANMLSWRTEQARQESIGAPVAVHANVCHSCGAPPAPTYPA